MKHYIFVFIMWTFIPILPEKISKVRRTKHIKYLIIFIHTYVYIYLKTESKLIKAAGVPENRKLPHV